MKCLGWPSPKSLRARWSLLAFESIQRSVNAAGDSFRLIVFGENLIDDYRSPIGLEPGPLPAVIMVSCVEVAIDSPGKDPLKL